MDTSWAYIGHHGPLLGLPTYLPTHPSRLINHTCPTTLRARVSDQWLR